MASTEDKPSLEPATSVVLLSLDDTRNEKLAVHYTQLLSKYFAATQIITDEESALACLENHRPSAIILMD